jgi:hypothetical protein
LQIDKCEGTSKNAADGWQVFDHAVNYIIKKNMPGEIGKAIKISSIKQATERVTYAKLHMAKEIDRIGSSNHKTR